MDSSVHFDNDTASISAVAGSRPGSTSGSVERERAVKPSYDAGRYSTPAPPPSPDPVASVTSTESLRLVVVTL